MFPSPYGVSSILIRYVPWQILRAYIPSEFPSPYGVSFILTVTTGIAMELTRELEFPSPYGVIFILTKIK